MDERHTFPALTSQFALACCLVTMTYLTTLSNRTPGWYYPLVLLVYAPAAYAVNRFFLHRERTLRGVVVLNALLWAGLFASVCWQEGIGDVAVLIFAGAFCLWVTVQGARLAMYGPNLRGLILTLDGSALMLVVFTGFLAAMDLNYLWGAPAAAGFAACILGMTANRMGRPMGAREWTLVGGAFVLISLVVLFLVGVAAAPAGHGLVALWNFLVSSAQFLLGLLWRFLVFLASLFPEPEQSELDMEPLPSMPDLEEEVGESNPVVLVVMLIILAGLVAFAVVYLLRLLGRTRIGGRTKVRARNRVVRRRLSLLGALKRLFASWARRVRLRRYLWRHRDEPVGLYYCLERRCRMGPWHKRQGETPREFLTRLCASAKGDPELEHALAELVPQVDLALYAPGIQAVRISGAALIRRRIGRAVSRQFVQECTVRLRETINRAKTKKSAPARS